MRQLVKKSLPIGLTQHFLKTALCNLFDDRPLSYYISVFLGRSFLSNGFLSCELTTVFQERKSNISIRSFGGRLARRPTSFLLLKGALQGAQTLSMLMLQLFSLSRTAAGPEKRVVARHRHLPPWKRRRLEPVVWCVVFLFYRDKKTVAVLWCEVFDRDKKKWTNDSG